jgi:hypothetical protein
MDNTTLAHEYFDILKSLDVQFLDRMAPEGKRPDGLSGLFLTSVSDNYCHAKNKIMIVGSETAQWNILKDGEGFTDLKDYIKRSMDKHKNFFSRELNGEKSRGYCFHDFTRAVADKCGTDGLIYSNLFCFDWKNASPTKCEQFSTIKQYSEQLLKKQIEILEPGIIIFANGMSSVPHRRAYFPLSECENGRDYSSEGITNGHLWEFDLYKRIRCFRIHHPSAIVGAKDARNAREFLITLLPSA